METAAPRGAAASPSAILPQMRQAHHTKTSTSVRHAPSRISGASNKSERPVFGGFRPPEALSELWDRQITTQDEKPVLGKLSRSPGADASNKLERPDVCVLAAAMERAVALRADPQRGRAAARTASMALWRGSARL